MIVIYKFRAFRSQRGSREVLFPMEKNDRNPPQELNPFMLVIFTMMMRRIILFLIGMVKVMMMIFMMMMMILRRVVVVLGKNEGFGEKGQVLWKRWKR